MNTLLIESNRVIAQSTLKPTSAVNETKTSQYHTQKQDKASWTTSIESGIQLSPGDQISMEAAMMNIDGSTQGFQQFSGRVPIPEQGTNIYRKDNEMKIVLAFYTTNLIQNQVPLPAGRHMCETTSTMQGNNGAPCFTGRSLWQPHYHSMTGNSFTTDYDILPSGWSGAFYCGRNSLTCPTSIKRNAGSMFWVGMNYNFPLPNADPAGSPQPQVPYTKSAAWAAALIGWCANVPFYGVPGVQFGCNDSTKLPQTDAYGYNAATNDPRTNNNLNRNIDIKDTYPNAGYFTGADNKKNGGAAPQVLLNGHIDIHPTFPAAGGTSKKKLPYDWDEWNLGPHHYSFEAEKDSFFYKGSQYNYRPNGNRHFQPRIDDNARLCRGPFYSYDFNNLIDGSQPADSDMDNLANLHLHERSPTYWQLATSEFLIKLKTGNITPTRISEIITELMKKQKGTAAHPETNFVKQRTYQAPSNSQKDDTKDDLIILDQPNLSTQCYGLFPTVTGACLSAQKEYPNGELAGWDCLTEENLTEETIADDTSAIAPGHNFDPKQAELKYWSLMLAGDYLSWKWGTYLNPLISYRPFTSAEEVAPFQYKHWSVYSGPNNIIEAFGFQKFHKRKRPDGTDSTVTIGNLGEFGCLQDTPRYGKSLKPTKACAGVWNQINGTGNTTAPPFRLNCEPYALWADTTAPYTEIEYRTLGCIKYDVLPTNIVWNGQVTLKTWNEAFDELEGHNIVDGGNDTLNSQSNEFFDNTFVEWTIGRLDDQETYNELWIADDFGFRQKNQNNQGYAQYMPNIYQSNRMYQEKIYDAGAGGNWTDIDNELSRASCGVVNPDYQGSYTLMYRKIGTYYTGGSYTATHNPWAYPSATGSTLYSPDKIGFPCYGCFKSEYEDDIEKKSGYQKVAHRKIKAFRYLPQANLYNGYEYTAINAFNKNLLQPFEAYQKWSTRPATMPFEEYEIIFNDMKNMNNGKGMGIIPIFSSDNHYSTVHNNIPFVGVIYMDHEDKQMPAPVKGEWFGLSSPSLSQHDLSLPASTQRTPQDYAGSGKAENETREYASGYIGEIPFGGAPNPDKVDRFLESNRPSNWATTYYTGANDPIWAFNNTVNRFEYSQFHTPLYTGNGKWAYGDTGETASPETKEVRVVANTSNFSRVTKLAYGVVASLNNNGTVIYPALAEIMDGSVRADWTSPGGWYNDVSPGGPNHQNPQYLSPLSCTQWELRYLPIPGTQIKTSGIVEPQQTHRNDTKDITAPSIIPYPYITTSPEEKYPTVSSQGGVGICELKVPRIGADDLKLTHTDFALFSGTMFWKMGFDLGNFLPVFYQTQTQFNHTLFSQNMQPTDPAGLQYNNCLFPVCTQAIISSSIAPALTTGWGYAVKEPVPSAEPNQIYPFYKTGMILRTAATNADSESMFASRLPQKLAFPYLVCRSNIATPCSLQYIGGPDGKQISPTVAVLATNYSTDDFFFTTRSDLIFKVTRPYVLTEIKTSIHLPNGDSADPILDENSAVIYRIDFAEKQETDKEILKDKEEEDKLLGVVEE